MGGSMIPGRRTWVLVGVLALCPVIAFGAAEPVVTTTVPTTLPASVPTTAPTTAPVTAAVVEEPAEFRPRFELFVPSLQRLVAETRRSHSGLLIDRVGEMLGEVGSMSAEGVDVESAAALLDRFGSWPDTSLDAAVFAADNEGRMRWAIRFDWPLADLYERLAPLLELEAAESILEGVRLAARADGGYVITVPEATVGYLLPVGDTRSVFASHADIAFPTERFRGTEESEANGDSLLVCRLNLVGTEKDSGATFFSSLSAVTDVVHGCRVDEAGEWVELTQVHWPPGVGMAAKALLGKVQQTFFVPDEAYGGAVLSSPGAPAMLEAAAGFGPQMMMEEGGGFGVVGEAEPGPLARYVGSDVCLTVLPGTGLFPIPDVVCQAKVKRAERLIDGLRETVESINTEHLKREHPAPWHEDEWCGRTVFWSDGGGGSRGLMVPAVMRPVLFVSREIDAKDRERDFVVLAWTSTSPRGLVRRWVGLPRGENRRYLPTVSKTRGEVWFNWDEAYSLLLPYANVSLSAVSGDLLLPPVADMADRLTDASLDAKIRYSGLSVSHQGPIPAGVLVVPVLFGIATSVDYSGSDLARERSACRNLKVLYHHAKLFRQDMGRWPAELAELDGYIDFAGHPYLLRLELSAKKRRGDWMDGLFGDDEEDESEDEDFDEEEDDTLVGLDEDLFVISWGRESWSLGIVPGSFEHLDRLFIDQDGKIHRVEKTPVEESETKGSE